MDICPLVSSNMAGWKITELNGGFYEEMFDYRRVSHGAFRNSDTPVKAMSYMCSVHIPLSHTTQPYVHHVCRSISHGTVSNVLTSAIVEKIASNFRG